MWALKHVMLIKQEEGEELIDCHKHLESPVEMVKTTCGKITPTEVAKLNPKHKAKEAEKFIEEDH